MKVTVTDQQNCKKQVRLEIPADSVREESEKVVASLAKRLSLPGFRRGKVPASVVRSRFKREVRDEVVSHVLPVALHDAVVQEKLRLVGKPEIEDLKFGEDDTIEATFSVEVAPEFELYYKNLLLTRRVYVVTEADIDREVARLRREHAELVPVEERGAQAGDLVTVNLTGRYDDEEAPDERLSRTEAEVELGADRTSEEFEVGLKDATVGETREISVGYPEDHFNPALAGRRVIYTAEVVAVRTREIPEAGDEFAQGVSERFSTLEELRSDIRSQLERFAANRSETDIRNGAMGQLLDRNRFSVPESPVVRQRDSRIKGFLEDMRRSGINPRDLELDWDEWQEAQHQRAERDVRGSFILESIALEEGIEASEADLEGEIERISQSIGQSVAAVRARLTKEEALDSIRAQIKSRKALDSVIASAEITEETVQGLDTGEGSSGEPTSEDE